MAKVPQGAKQLDHAPPLLRSGGSGFTEPRREIIPSIECLMQLIASLSQRP